MNNYSLEDIVKGQKESFKVVITDKMMEAFKGITGDINPLHNDKEYAVSKNFDDRVAYGMLTSSFLSTLAGVYLPGEKSLIREVEVKMKMPVYVGDELTITGEVTEINNDFKFFIMNVAIRNQNNEKVLRGKMNVGILD